jgi:hypothetical protein
MIEVSTARERYAKDEEAVPLKQAIQEEIYRYYSILRKDPH